MGMIAFRNNPYYSAQMDTPVMDTILIQARACTKMHSPKNAFVLHKSILMQYKLLRSNTYNNSSPVMSGRVRSSQADCMSAHAGFLFEALEFINTAGSPPLHPPHFPLQPASCLPITS